MNPTGLGSLPRRFGRYAQPADIVCTAYVLLFGLGLLIFGQETPSGRYLLAVHIGLFCAIIGIVVRWHDRTRGFTGFIRQLYPPMLYTFFYSETRVALHWLLSEFQDHRILAFERWLFGVDLNVWVMPAQKALVNEIMMLGYFSYYLLVPILALTLFFRRQMTDLSKFLTAATIAFAISYIGFVVFPVEGPRYFLAEHFAQHPSGFLFVPLVWWIIDHGAIHGGCMPSSHVAVALVVLIWAYRTQQRLAVVLTPFVITLFISTAWGRFHYVSDIAAGLLVGIVALWLADRWWRLKSSPLTTSRLNGETQRAPVAKTAGGIG